MDAKRSGLILLACAFALPATLPAQTLPASSVATSAGSDLGGTPTTDFITLKALGPGVPLRFGGVSPNSETVTMSGMPLERGKDYNMDYSTGVVCLMRAQTAGDVLLVSYRYDSSRTRVPVQPFSGLGGFKFDLLPGNLSMIVGLGMAERATDGSVYSSNVFGMNNSLSLGHSVGLKGLMLVNPKDQVDAKSGYEYQAATAKAPEGGTQLIVQSVQSGLSGGNLKLDYQSVGRSFNGFGQALAAGYDQATVDQLAKEKGLQRMGFALDGLKLGSMSLTDGMRTIGEGDNKISWKNFGLSEGGFSMNWQSRSVSQGFTRFADLSETDKDQLKNEAGLSRETLNSMYGARFGKLGFTESRIEDGKGQAIEHRQYMLDTSKIKFTLNEQSIDPGFTRFSSLFEPDKAQWGKEVGLSRQSMALDAALTANEPLHFTQNLIHSATGDLSSRDLSYVGKTWSFRHDERGTDAGFGAMGSLPGGEVDDQIKAIANMYASDIKPTGDDRNAYLHSVGIDRRATQLEMRPFKDLKLAFESLNLRGKTDAGKVDSFQLQGKNLGFTYRRESLGQNFSELASLMNFEKARLGSIAGLDRSDLGLTMDLKGGRKFTLSSMDAETAQGGAHRQSAELATGKLDISLSSRKVDPGFAQVNQLVDLEKDLLGSLKGLKESEAKIKWQLTPSLKIDALYSSANGLGIEEQKLIRNLFLAWAPDKQTNVEVTHQDQHSNDPLSVLFANVVDQIVLSRDFGRLGKLKLTQLKQEFDGPQAQQPGFDKQAVQYETKLDSKTTLSAEQSFTRFDNGDKEDVRSETVATTLSKVSGVSITDTSVDRDGVDRDEHKRNYGFWYALSNGLKLSYGYARQLVGDQNGTSQSNVSLTGGTVGGVKVDNSGYAANEWDRTRTQATSNVSLSSAKPMKFGKVSDLKFNVGMDTAADYSNWLKENRLISMSGKYLGATIGYLYKSQLAANGERGIDRGVQLSTDQSDKAKFSVNFSYKLRTLPGDQQVMIRDYGFKLKPIKDFELSNTLTTHPEIAKPDAILGSVTQNSKADKWKLDYKRNPNATVGGIFQETIADGAVSRTGGITVTFNAPKGSPFTVFYGGETSDSGGQRRTLSRYELRYDQKAGPNQKLSLLAGNVTYEHTIVGSGDSSGITIRVDYTGKF